ncbi:MAG: TPR end-of-group domain-containing protein [Myxococcaceae bacterium]
MLRFRLGPIPISLHASHVLVALLLGFDFAPGRGENWMLVVLAAAGVVFSVLVHELGHAAAALRFGYQPTIELAWLGGHTAPNAPGPIPWARDVGLTLAGPLAGLVLSLTSYALGKRLALNSPTADFLFKFLFQANLLWTVLNLVPVLPLDGGRIAHAIFVRMFGPRGSLGAHVLGGVVGAFLTFVAFRLGALFAAVLFGLMAFRSASVVRQMMGKPPEPPEEPLLDTAQARLAAGDLSEAKRFAERALASDKPMLTHARAHRVLGWVALKQGQGRMALDHFAQVQRLPIEGEALAAAFSLVGDDARALPLWEMAHKSRASRTLLHEWAGTLLRLGKTEQALGLPAVDVETAYACATRVLFLREQFGAAASLGETALEKVHSPALAYDTACAWARAGQVDDALRCLRLAKTFGFQGFGHARDDADLDALRGHPEFDAWLTNA